jgi:valyl-tRNA synthetase
LWHASDTLVRLYAPFTPYVTDALSDILHGQGDTSPGTVHARGMWPKAEDQAAPDLFAAEGEAFVQILAAARKVKSEAQLSMKTPVTRFVVSGEPAALITAVLAQTGGDLAAVVNATCEIEAGEIDDALASAASPDERFRTGLVLEPEIKAS